MTEAKAPESIRPPKQRRSAASFERVLDAAEELLKERGYEGFTLPEVSRRAGVSIGSIYTRIPSKDALFYAVHERVTSRTIGRAKLAEPEAWQHMETRDMILGAVREIATRFKSNEEFNRVVMRRGAADGHVAAVGSEMASQQAELFKALLLTRRDEITHRHPELAVDVSFRMVWNALARQVMYGPTFESQQQVEWDDLVHELGVACAAYLLGTPA